MPMRSFSDEHRKSAKVHVYPDIKIRHLGTFKFWVLLQDEKEKKRKEKKNRTKPELSTQ